MLRTDLDKGKYEVLVNYFTQCHDGKGFIMVTRMRLSPGNAETGWDIVEGQLWTERDRDSSASGVPYRVVSGLALVSNSPTELIHEKQEKSRE